MSSTFALPVSTTAQIAGHATSLFSSFLPFIAIVLGIPLALFLLEWVIAAVQNARYDRAQMEDEQIEGALSALHKGLGRTAEKAVSLRASFKKTMAGGENIDIND